jgi:deoxyhypusine synthase
MLGRLEVEGMNEKKEAFIIEYLEQVCGGLGGNVIDDLQEMYREDLFNGDVSVCFEIWVRENNYIKVGNLYYTSDEVSEAEKAYKEYLEKKHLSLVR